MVTAGDGCSDNSEIGAIEPLSSRIASEAISPMEPPCQDNGHSQESEIDIKIAANLPVVRRFVKPGRHGLYPQQYCDGDLDQDR